MKAIKCHANLLFCAFVNKKKNLHTFFFAPICLSFFFYSLMQNDRNLDCSSSEILRLLLRENVQRILKRLPKAFWHIEVDYITSRQYPSDDCSLVLVSHAKHQKFRIFFYIFFYFLLNSKWKTCNENQEKIVFLLSFSFCMPAYASDKFRTIEQETRPTATVKCWVSADVVHSKREKIETFSRIS